jgi:hypothetical protein
MMSAANAREGAAWFAAPFGTIQAPRKVWRCFSWWRLTQPTRRAASRREGVRGGIDPGFELGVERVEIPARAGFAQMFDRRVGHEPARCAVAEPGNGPADQRACVDGCRGR